MYLWRKRADTSWLRAHQEPLHSRAGDRLAIIARPNRRLLHLEIASESRKELRELINEFGGQIQELPGDWLQRFTRQQRISPIRIGKRLVISRSGGLQTAGYCKSAAGKPPLLVIPAGAAFGTGEHVTTAMSLRMLERVMKSGRDGSPSRPSNLSDPATAGEKRPYLMVDLGTGSAILALAASRLGARRVIGIDNDPIAIATARQNAQLNKIRNVRFEVADVRRRKFPRKIDIIAANLFSELLVAILPKLKHIPRLILSGIMRDEQAEVIHALKQNKIDIIEVRRRGKWIAILAGELRRP